MKFNPICLLIALLFNVTFLSAQDVSKKIPNVAVFSPLYLDSAFNEKGYKFGKKVPSFAVPGVEFYYGAKKAMDSLNAADQYCNFFVYDSKSKIKPIESLVASNELNNMDMLIGSITGTDVKYLADYAKSKNIPFISATYPNAAGVTNNPNFVMLNGTLQTLCEKLHQFIIEKVSDQRLVFFTKEGKQEERILTYFKELNTKANFTKIEYVNLGATHTAKDIAKYFDTTVLTTYIVGSNEVAFAKDIATAIAKNKLNEQSNMMGLVTWENADDFNDKQFKDLYFYHVTPLAHPTGTLATQMGNDFKKKYGLSPGDNVFRGFEAILKYTNLLVKYGNVKLLEQLKSTEYSTIHNYDIKPIEANGQIDYYENKKVHVVKRINGSKTTLNF